MNLSLENEETASTFFKVNLQVTCWRLLHKLYLVLDFNILSIAKAIILTSIAQAAMPI